MGCDFESFRNKAIHPARFIALVSIALFIGFGPAPAAADPFVYVTNRDSTNTVSVIDADPQNDETFNTVVKTINVFCPGCFDPNSVAVTPDGAFAYVVNEGPGPFSSTVAVINTETNMVEDTVEVSGPLRVT